MERRILNTEIALEKLLHDQIYSALQGKVVEQIIRQARTGSSDNYWRSNMEGHSFKVEKPLMSHIYTLFEQVKQNLNFTQEVDLYITGDSSVNAFSLAAECEDEHHIVNLNSALVELMTDDELKFVIGHELGHLINRDTALMRLISFVFPQNTIPPVTLQYKIRLWQQLSELVADRYGYIAAGNLDSCVSAFFKMASGLNISKMDISVEALLAENIKHLEYFLKDKGVSRAAHPVNPIRIQSLNLYASASSDEALNVEMEDMIGILLKLGNSEVDMHLPFFIASAGLIVANADGNVSEDEIRVILENLSSYHIFPKAFLNEVVKMDVNKVFFDSVSKILEADPGMRENMFCYVVNLVISDRTLDVKEIDLLYGVAENVFSYSRKEAARILANLIQANYVPSVEAIY